MITYFSSVVSTARSHIYNNVGDGSRTTEKYVPDRCRLQWVR
jgi:hypothetical protein